MRPIYRPRARWQLVSTADRSYDQPVSLDWEHWRDLTQGRTIVRSADGFWAEIHEPDGTVVATLLRYDQRKDAA